ncbi:pyridoxamine 5'-phosphate oxidase family protein [Hydrogenimonas sp.]
MGKKYEAISPRHRAFIEAQKIFFVATAAPEGRVNLSPKGMDTFRVIDENRIVWLNVTGSANETAAHLQESPRMTIMFAAFEGDPKILRLYGEARAIYEKDAEWEALIGLFPPLPGARQIFDMRVDLVHTSCGMSVPLFDYVGERDDLNRWAEKKGEEGIRAYWRERNSVSLDGKPIETP